MPFPTSCLDKTLPEAMTDGPQGYPVLQQQAYHLLKYIRCIYKKYIIIK